MKKLLLLAGLFITLNTQAQLVQTVAGVLDSIGMINGPVNQAFFNNPHGIAADSVGNLYVADRFGHVIRKITPAGIVSTLAGTGSQGSQDGPGATATFNEPWGICVEYTTGIVYVADTRNNLIRKIDAAGNVTTLAGSGNFGITDAQGTSSTFGNPTGIEIAADGSIYVADHLTHIIRRISPNGFVSTIAGKAFVSGTTDGQGNVAQFNRPYGLTIDMNGDILVADEWNHLIRKMTPTGMVTTIAGTGVVGSTNGQALQAEFNFPWDIAVDSMNNIFIVDGFNDVVRRIDASNNVISYAGNPGTSGATDAVGQLASFNGATGITYLGSTDELYIADAYNNLIRKIVNLNQQSVAMQVISAGGTIICEGDSFGVRAAPGIYDTYDFFVDNIQVQSSQNEFYYSTTLTPGNHTIKVIAYDNGNAITSSPLQVTVNAKPTPTITTIGATTFYEGDSVTLVASSGTSYLWSNGATTATVLVKSSGSYWVEITNQAGCSNRSDSILIDVIQFSATPLISFVEGSELVCYGEPVILTSSYDQNNQWLKEGFPIADATDQTYTVTQNGSYQVQVLDSLGFILFSDAIDITIRPKQIRNFFASDSVAVKGNTIQFTSYVNEINLDYFWDFGDVNSGSNNISNTANPAHLYAESGVYTVSLITGDIFGCSDTLVKDAYIQIDETDTGGGGGTGGGTGADIGVFIPSAFTPNNDGQNDLFYVRGNDIQTMDMAIYNQWGELVFENSDLSFGWDGTHGSKQVENGTYVYVVELTKTDGSAHSLSGHVTVLR